MIRAIQLTDASGNTASNNRKRLLDSNPWSLSAGVGTGNDRAFGRPFESHIYRQLLAEFVVDTNPSFSVIESRSFRSLL